MNCFSVNFVGVLLIMGRFLSQFGRSLAVASIMSKGYFPVNLYQMLKRYTKKRVGPVRTGYGQMIKRQPRGVTSHFTGYAW
jgi:hypothetical protein